MEPLLLNEETTEPESWLNNQLLKALLNIPHGGLIGITSALLFSAPQRLCAYWWRDPESGEDFANFVDEERLRLAIGRVSMDTGYLPAHALRLGMSSRGAPWMLIYQPPKRYRLTLEFAASHLVPLQLKMPAGLFFGLGDQYYLWAVKKGALTGKTPLYHYPLPNISEHGLLCYGTNAPSRVAWSGILPTLCLFLESPFNGHWARGKSSVHEGDIRERLRTLADSPPAAFPDSELVPIASSSPFRSEPQPITLDMHLSRVIQAYA